MSDLNFWIVLAIDGLANGSIYGLFAICLVLIFRANKHFNFCLTQLAALILMLVTLALKRGFSPWIVLPAGIFLGFSVGVFLHFGVMRFVTERKRIVHGNEALLTIGLFSIFSGVANIAFSDEAENFPVNFSRESVPVFGLNLSFQSIGIIVVSLLVFGGVFLFFRLSKLGLKMEAVAENVTAARLRGIRASNVLALAWGMTTAISVLAGLLVAPIVFVFPQMFSQIFSYSLMAVAIGGLESPLGAICGGLLIGVIENVGSQIEWIGSELKFVVVLSLLLSVLVIKPRGLWGRKYGRTI